MISKKDFEDRQIEVSHYIPVFPEFYMWSQVESNKEIRENLIRISILHVIAQDAEVKESKKGDKMEKGIFSRVKARLAKSMQNEEVKTVYDKIIAQSIED